MAIYAVIKTGGKQYRVAPGDIVQVEKLAVAPGATVEINEIYLLANDDDITAGSPTVANARVTAEVIEEGRHDKLVIFKKRRRKHYQRTIGHRQYFTTLRISEIALGNNVYKAEARVSTPNARETIAAAPAQISSPARPQTTPASKEIAPSNFKPAAPPAVVPDVSNREIVAKPASPQNQAPAKLPEPAAPISPVQPATPPLRTAPASDETRRIFNQPTPRVEPSVATEAPFHRKHRPWLAAGAIVLLLAGLGLLLFGTLGKRAGENTVPMAAEQTTPAAPKPSKVKPVRDIKIKNPTAGSTPSAPVRPPD